MRQLKSKIWPYTITIGCITAINNSIDEWCSRNVGRRFSEWYGYNLDVERRIYAFKNQETLLVFKLIWGYKDGTKTDI